MGSIRLKFKRFIDFPEPGEPALKHSGQCYGFSLARALLLGFFVILQFHFPEKVASQSQTTYGDCSPIINEVKGDVNIDCSGLPPKALVQLNKILKEQFSSLEKKIEEANKWKEKFDSLNNQLQISGMSDAMAEKARQFLEAGEFKKARHILDELALKEEKKLASIYYSRGLMHELEFNPLRALTEYKKASNLDPDKLDYVFSLAKVYYQQKQYKKAEENYEQVLFTYRNRAKSKPEDYNYPLAKALNNIAMVYRDTNRFKKAESHLLAALEIKKKLQINGIEKKRIISNTLENLGKLYRAEKKIEEAKPQFEQSLKLRQFLVTKNKKKFQPFVVASLVDLGITFQDDKQFEASEKKLKQALKENEEVENKLISSANRGQINNILGHLYIENKKNELAAKKFNQALEIYEEFYERNRAYGLEYASTLRNLGLLHQVLKQYEKSVAYYKQSLEIYRNLAEKNFPAFGNYLASTLTTLSLLYQEQGKLEPAVENYQEALSIFKQLKEINPTVFTSKVITTLTAMLEVYEKLDRVDAVNKTYDETLGLLRTEIKTNPEPYKNYLMNMLLLYSIHLFDHSSSEQGCKILTEAEKIKKQFSLKKDLTKFKDTHCQS